MVRALAVMLGEPSIMMDGGARADPLPGSRVPEREADTT